MKWMVKWMLCVVFFLGLGCGGEAPPGVDPIDPVINPVPPDFDMTYESVIDPSAPGQEDVKRDDLVKGVDPVDYICPRCYPWERCVKGQCVTVYWPAWPHGKAPKQCSDCPTELECLIYSQMYPAVCEWDQIRQLCVEGGGQ